MSRDVEACRRTMELHLSSRAEDNLNFEEDCSIFGGKDAAEFSHVGVAKVVGTSGRGSIGSSHECTGGDVDMLLNEPARVRVGESAPAGDMSATDRILHVVESRDAARES